MVSKHFSLRFQNVTSPITPISPYTRKGATSHPVCARGRSLYLRPRDARCSREGSNRSSRVLGREEEVRERRERQRGKDDEGEGRPERSGSNLHRTRPPRGAARPAREFLPGRLQPRLSGRRKEGVPRPGSSTSSGRLQPHPPQPRTAHSSFPASPRPRASPCRPPHPAGPPARAPRPSPLPAPPGTPNSFTRRRPRPAPARRVGTPAGARRGGPLRTSLPHLGAAEPLAPAAAFSACAALAPSPKWRGPGVLAEPPPPLPPPPPPPLPLCLRRRGRRLGKSSSELTDEFGARRPQRAELSMLSALDSSPDGRAGRERLRAVWKEGRESAAGEREEAGPGWGGDGPGWRRWGGGPAR